MSDEPTNLVLEHLRAVRAKLSILDKNDRQTHSQLASFTRSMASSHRDQANDVEVTAGLRVQVDQLSEEVARITRRPDLVD